MSLTADLAREIAVAAAQLQRAEDVRHAEATRERVIREWEAAPTVRNVEFDYDVENGYTTLKVEIRLRQGETICFSLGFTASCPPDLTTQMTSTDALWQIDTDSETIQVHWEECRRFRYTAKGTGKGGFGPSFTTRTVRTAAP